MIVDSEKGEWGIHLDYCFLLMYMAHGAMEYGQYYTEHSVCATLNWKSPGMGFTWPFTKASLPRETPHYLCTALIGNKICLNQGFFRLLVGL